ncbi:MAG: anti-sigma factor antagonist [Eubacterium sp.]|nr:anti-sigma factor antagonist [Eubacterium sp.]
MECHYELKEGCLTISMPKELDHHIAEQLRMEADLLIDSYRVRNLIFDFTGTEFMDSSGIGVLIGRCRNMNYCGGSVKAQHMNERIQKIFRISGLHKLIETEVADHEETK